MLDQLKEAISVLIIDISKYNNQASEYPQFEKVE